jgi:hypothetical protein
VMTRRLRPHSSINEMIRIMITNDTNVHRALHPPTRLTGWLTVEAHVLPSLSPSFQHHAGLVGVIVVAAAAAARCQGRNV